MRPFVHELDQLLALLLANACYLARARALFLSLQFSEATIPEGFFSLPVSPVRSLSYSVAVTPKDSPWFFGARPPAMPASA
jgi:hypothetical protein